MGGSAENRSRVVIISQCSIQRQHLDAGDKACSHYYEPESKECDEDKKYCNTAMNRK
jgi:hypothetical protein